MDFAADNALLLADSPHTATVGEDTVRVLYDGPYKGVPLYDGQVESFSPACSMLDSDVVALAVQHNTEISISKDGTPVGDFTVTGVEPDGMGLTRLILTESD